MYCNFSFILYLKIKWIPCGLHTRCVRLGRRRSRSVRGSFLPILVQRSHIVISTVFFPSFCNDNVPGGAGLVARLEDTEVLKACLEAAMRRVSGKCGCDENVSCYGCLRTYRNQFAHQYLQRGSVYHYLRKILDSL